MTVLFVSQSLYRPQHDFKENVMLILPEFELIKVIGAAGIITVYEAYTVINPAKCKIKIKEIYFSCKYVILIYRTGFFDKYLNAEIVFKVGSKF